MKRILLLVTVLAASQAAFADVYNIDRDNSGGALCSTLNPCGTVTTSFSAGDINFLIQMASGFGVFGNNDAFGFNVVGTNTGVNISNVSPSPAFDGTGGTGNEDGWGSFEFRINGPGGSGAVSTLSFDVTRTSPAFTGLSDILQTSTGGNGTTLFALHVRNNSSGLTGYAGVDAAAVPEPSAFVFLVPALLGLGYFARKRRLA